MPHDLVLDSVGLDRKTGVHGWCCITSDLEVRSWADATRSPPVNNSTETESTDWPTQSDSESTASTVEKENTETETAQDPALLDLNQLVLNFYIYIYILNLRINH